MKRNLWLLAIAQLYRFAAAELATSAFREKDRAQGAINFFTFAVLALSSFASGALVTTRGWTLLNLGSLLPVVVTGAALVWLAFHRRGQP